MVDVAALAVIALNAIWGWRRGVILMAIGLAGVLLGYAAAYGLSGVVSDVLKDNGVQPLAARVVAGLSLFFIVQIIAAIVGFVVSRRNRDRAADSWDQPSGAILGLVRGLVVCILLAWLAGLYQAFVPASSIRVAGSAIGALARPLVSQTLGGVLERSTGSTSWRPVVRRVARSPKRAAWGITKVTQDARVKQLFGDVDWLIAMKAVPEGHYAPHPALASIANDEKFVKAARAAGMLRSTDRTPDAIKKRLGRFFAPFVRFAFAMMKDAELQQQFNDSRLTERIQNKQVWSLLNDEAFNKFAIAAAHYMRGDEHMAASGSVERQENVEDQDSDAPVAGKVTFKGEDGEQKTRRLVDVWDRKTTGRVYKWKDPKTGRLRFADQPPSGRDYEIVSRPKQ